jgi:F-type H+-transporting ATPase subunit beta
VRGKFSGSSQGFKEVSEGNVDHLPEQAFYMVSNLDAAKEKAKELGATV